jgi:hypothetical protein
MSHILIVSIQKNGRKENENNTSSLFLSNFQHIINDIAKQENLTVF